jgi:hypothetical protein
MQALISLEVSTPSSKKKICNQHAQEWSFSTQSVILHAEYYFYTHECNFDTYECDYEMFECDLYTQGVLSTHTRVSLIRMRVNMTIPSVFLHAQLLFLHAEYDFHSQSVVFTHTRVILTLMRMNMTPMITTRRSVITTRTRVIYTLRV